MIFVVCMLKMQQIMYEVDYNGRTLHISNYSYFYVGLLCYVDPVMPTLQLHSNGLLHSNTVIDTLAVDGWTVIFGTARRGLGGLGPRPVPSSLYQR